jgi:hypothetical protein
MGLRWVDIIWSLTTCESQRTLRPPLHLWFHTPGTGEPLNLATLSCFVVYVSVYAAHDRCGNQTREVGLDTLLQTCLEAT